MKTFQIVENWCFKDYTPIYSTVSEAKRHFAPDIKFVETPDFVFEGWGYNPKAKGDARFIKPTPPEGFAYDDKTGTFYKLLLGKEKREQQYMLKSCIEYDGLTMTVDQAGQYALHYFFEDDEESQKKVAELKTLITAAKEEIRKEYPDENEPYK